MYLTFFRDHNVITTLQSGFLPGDSTINQLTDLYNTFCKALDDGKEVRAIFCDVSKAFDRVWHKGLLFKLKSVGISGSLLNWFVLGWAYRGLTGGFLLLQNFCVAISVSPHVCFILVLILISMFLR